MDARAVGDHEPGDFPNVDTGRRRRAHAPVTCTREAVLLARRNPLVPYRVAALVPDLATVASLRNALAAEGLREVTLLSQDVLAAALRQDESVLDPPHRPAIAPPKKCRQIVLEDVSEAALRKALEGAPLPRRERQEHLADLPAPADIPTLPPAVDESLAVHARTIKLDESQLSELHRELFAIASQAAVALHGLRTGVERPRIENYLQWILRISSWTIQDVTSHRRELLLLSHGIPNPAKSIAAITKTPLVLQEASAAANGQSAAPLFGTSLVKEIIARSGSSEFSQALRKLAKKSDIPANRPSDRNRAADRYKTVTNRWVLSVRKSGLVLGIALRPVASTKQAGCLADFRQNWQLIGSDEWTLNVLLGFTIPFAQMPPMQRHPPSTTGCPNPMLAAEIEDLKQKGAIRKIARSEVRWLSIVFAIPKKDGSARPVVNLKPLNKYLESRHFKMESISSLRSLLTQGDFMIKIDMKDAFFGIPMAPSSQPYLSICFADNYYCFTALPFGLSLAPYVYAKVMRTVAAWLRSQGIRLIVYLDDWLFLEQSRTTLERLVPQLLALFEHLGMVVNTEKSELQPTQTIEFLGLRVCAKREFLSIPDNKIQRIKTDCDRLLATDRCSIRRLSETLGRINACSAACYYSALMSRRLQMALRAALAEAHNNYEASMSLSSECLEDLRWWSKNLARHAKRPLREPTPSVVITTDASKLGWGATSGGASTGGNWSPEEAAEHINVLQLKAILFGLRVFAERMRDCAVLIQSDNTVAISYINRFGGTANNRLIELARTIWFWARDRNLFLIATHLPGKENAVADAESRSYTLDWHLHKEITARLFDFWGTPEIDLFATRHSIVPIPTLEPPSASETRGFSPCGMENLISDWRAAGLNETAAMAMLNSWAPSTRGTYNAQLKAFANWCREHSVILSQASVVDLLNYLADRVSTPGGALGERSDAEVEDITANEFHKMTTIEKMKTLRCLVAKDPLPEVRDVYRLMDSNNCRLQFAFQQITLKARWLPGVPYALQKLFDWPEVRDQAIEQYENNEPTMHPFSAGAIRKML
ncbi:hypothetical protein QR680_017214 [Steinernema hermaphroditum]|uniref:Reverse transcriptase domain-containing protein n=1 Tax=Steinernema hermaphroditum TaxID=289476 RepID=A0AA39HDR4_9BILA|nr:hypothetical protein QR680_017214 [Steinernema hermaphroditum]